MTAPSRLDERDLRELLLLTTLEVQRAEQQRGSLPPDGHTVLGRLGAVFEYAAALMLGLLIASGTMLLVFIVTRVLLHVDFSRYTWL